MLGKRVRIESSVGSVVECLVVAERLDGYIQAAQSLLVANTFSAVAIAQTRSAYRPCLCGLVFHESGVRRWAELGLVETVDQEYLNGQQDYHSSQYVLNCRPCFASAACAIFRATFHGFRQLVFS